MKERVSADTFFCFIHDFPDPIPVLLRVFLIRSLHKNEQSIKNCQFGDSGRMSFGPVLIFGRRRDQDGICHSGKRAHGISGNQDHLCLMFMNGLR